MSRDETERAFERYERHWSDHGFGLLGVVDRASGALIGRAGVQYHRAWPRDPEVGWGLDPAWWGLGLATEAGRACVTWGFDGLAFERLVSITTAENAASRRVMAKLGFELLETVTFRELEIDLLVHALDRTSP
jgi:RimJ/RimL family protein N-acetyltransferase